MSELIRCGDHSLAPWCVVCRHLLDGSADRWCAVPSAEPSSEVLYDWLCDECFRTGADVVPVEDLRCVCIHCVRAMQGENFVPFMMPSEENDPDGQA